MRKYKVGEKITSIDELVNQKAVFQYIGGWNEHWKYLTIGWVISYQLHYVMQQIEKGHFAYAIKMENKNEKI